MSNKKIKNTIFKRYQKSPIKGLKYAKNISNLQYGILGVRICEPSLLNLLQFTKYKMKWMYGILKKFLKKKKITFWNYSTVYRIISKKPIGVRMGGGKGPNKFEVIKTLPGMILWEFSTYKQQKSKILLYMVKNDCKRLGIKTQILWNNNLNLSRRLFKSKAEWVWNGLK